MQYFITCWILVLFWTPSLAQIWEIEIEEEFESYVPGDQIYQDWWLDWNCNGACAIYCSDLQANTGTQSGYIPGDQSTSAVFDLGNRVFPSCYVTFYMYIPAGKEASWNLQDEVPVGNSQSIIGNVHFNQNGNNPGEGVIEDAPGSPILFNFPHDQWFEISLGVDLSASIFAATFTLEIDQQIVIPWGTPFTNSAGEIPTSLGGLNFISNSGLSEFWIDDIVYVEEGAIIGFNDNTKNPFSIALDALGNSLKMYSEVPITSISIYNLPGQLMHTGPVNDGVFSLDVSSWANGTYILQAVIDGRSQTLKFIK